MTDFPRWTTSIAAVSLLIAASTASGQGASPAAAHSASRASMPRNASPSPLPVPLPPGEYARPSVAASAARTSPAVPVVKPFQMAPHRPTISPYLQLHREDLDDTLPNYFAFVLPQMQQQEQIHRQQLELERIHQRLQQTGNPAAAGQGTAHEGTDRMPPNYHSRFMNTGGYFSGVTAPPSAGNVKP